MSKFKKLTASQKACLEKLAAGNGVYFDLVRVGANGSTIKALTNAGLISTFYPGEGVKEWRITIKGRKALTEGRYSLAEPAQEESHGDCAAVAAIQFALETDEGMEFLRCWNHGDFDAIRKEWPEAPEAVFIGADPLHKTA